MPHAGDTQDDAQPPETKPSNSIILPPTRSGRVRRAPRALCDFVPNNMAGRKLYRHLAPLVPLPPPPPEPVPRNPTPVTPEVAVVPTTVFETTPDTFGVFRRYAHKPLREPENEQSPDNLVNVSTIVPTIETTNAEAYTAPVRSIFQKTRDAVSSWFFPFQNASSFRLLHWRYTGSRNKSTKETQRIADMCGMDDFKPAHMKDFSVTREEKRLDKGMLQEQALTNEGWRKSSIKIPLPKEGVQISEDLAPRLKINDVWHRPLIPLIKAVAESTTAHHFQFVPYKLFACTTQEEEIMETDASGDPILPASNPDDEERIYSKAYTADAMLEEDSKIRAQPRNPEDGPEVEYASVALMAWSDSTHLAQFGTASLWPIYLYFASLSKYVQGKASSFAAHHLAYIPKVRHIILI